MKKTITIAAFLIVASAALTGCSTIKDVIDVAGPVVDAVNEEDTWITVGDCFDETDDEIVERIHKVLDVVPAERVYLTTDCGLKALPRFVAHEKLRALSRAAKRVRAELGAPVAA